MTSPDPIACTAVARVHTADGDARTIAYDPGDPPFPDAGSCWDGPVFTAPRADRYRFHVSFMRDQQDGPGGPGTKAAAGIDLVADDGTCVARAIAPAELSRPTAEVGVTLWLGEHARLSTRSWAASRGDGDNRFRRFRNCVLSVHAAAPLSGVLGFAGIADALEITATGAPIAFANRTPQHPHWNGTRFVAPRRGLYHVRVSFVRDDPRDAARESYDDTFVDVLVDERELVPRLHAWAGESSIWTQLGVVEATLALEPGNTIAVRGRTVDATGGVRIRDCVFSGFEL